MKKVACALLLVVMMGTIGAYPAETSTFTGLVISVSDTYIEIKKKSKEVVLYWTDGSRIMSGGAAADRSAVEICQKVRAAYVMKDGRRELVSLDILRESYCAE